MVIFIAAAACLGIVLAPLPVQAQATAGSSTRSASAPGEVRGTVYSEDTALAGAGVSLHFASDSSLAAGAITNEAGHFRIAGLAPGRYFARVEFLGYSSRTLDVALDAAGPRADLGRILLAVEAVDAGAVQVEVQAAPARLEVDRTTFHARDLAAAASGQAADVLRNVPAVEVDADGNVSLRGNPNVAVQVNGRATPLKGAALAGFLRQMPASMIDRVEVIHNPSARHDPEGMGGIINLVLKQDTEAGLSGGVNASLGSGEKYAISGNAGGAVGPVTLFGSYGFTEENRDLTDYTLRANRFTDPITLLQQDGSGALVSGGHVLQLNADWKAGERDVVSSAVMLNQVRNKAGSSARYALLDNDHVELSTSGAAARQRLELLMADVSLQWKRTLAPRSDLSAELRFTSSDDDLRSDFDALTRGDLIAEREINAFVAGYQQWAGQLDYTRPLTEGLSLETGYRGTLRHIANDFDATRYSRPQLLPGSEVIDSQWTSRFRYAEDVHAAYAVLTGTVGRLQLQGGLRGEHAATDFDLTGAARELSVVDPSSSYTSLYPSGSALLTLSETRQARLSYSKRVQRPHYRYLNPFAVAEDPQNIFVGNPGLRPEYTHSLELSLQRTTGWGSVQVMPFFRRTVDPIRRYKSVDDQGVATTTFRNMDVADAVGSDVTTTFRLAGALTGMMSVSGYQMETDGSAIEPGLSSESFIWSARGNLSWRVRPGLDAQGSLFHRGPVTVEQGRVESFTVVNLSLRQRLLGDRASLTLRVSDPFNAMRFAFHTEDENHWQDTRRKMESRALYLGMSYTFGKPLRPRAPRPPAETQPDDMGIR